MMAEQEFAPESNMEQEESCKIIWSEPDSEGHRHFKGLECDSTDARDRAAVDLENQELFVRVGSVKKEEQAKAVLDEAEGQKLP